MSKAIEQLSRDLARGMSRRRALWKLAAGVGALSFLTTQKASAQNSGSVCFQFMSDVYSCCLDTGKNADMPGGCFGFAEQSYSECLGGGLVEVELIGNGQICVVVVDDNRLAFEEDRL